MITSMHAERRMREMRVSWTDIVEVLKNPEVTYPSPPSHGPGRLISLHGRLAVVHNGRGLVVTVLWRGHTTSDRSAPPPEAA